MFEDFVFRVAVSSTYICLLFVLILFKYDLILATVVFIVAASGYIFPIVFGIPYIIILLRIIVGLRVATDQKLYIARCIEHTDVDLADSSGSTTLYHWAVAIEDNKGRHFYTQAVGKVISGKGKKIPFGEMKEDTLAKYCLDHVGFVTSKERETKTEMLVDAVPMKSGNSCQEYAVDIAFQLSSSRTYTFVKIMALPRLRNTLLLTALAVSILLVVFDCPHARVFNLLTINNMFAAWELSRIGIHNQAQAVDLQYICSVLRAYYIYPRKVDLYILLLILGSCAYLYQQRISEQLIVPSILLFAVILLLLKPTKKLHKQTDSPV